MVEINKKPIINYIIFYKFNIKEIIIAGGYKYKIIQNYFKKKYPKDLNIKVLNTGLIVSQERELNQKNFIK